MSEDNVVQLRIPPKQLERQYRQTKYKITFVPATKKWQWTVTFTHVVEHDGVADTQNKAFKAAEKFIDQHLGVSDASSGS